MTEQSYGRYQIVKELGRGGMAIVYLAHDPRFKRDVALKVLPYHFAHDATFKARFEREAETIAALEHPAIVTVYDFGEDHDQPYFVMRPMMGGSLADRLVDGPLPLSEISVILTRVGSALDRAHGLGMVHRDLKPGNILFDQYGEAFLSDFGIVHIAESTQLTGTQLIGTPAYMSPEQAQGAAIDATTDIYTLGIILYEMLTGQQPYQATTPMGILYKQVHDPLPKLRDSGQVLPPVLDQIISRATAKKPAERYPTAGQFAGAVAAVAAVPGGTPPAPTPVAETGTILLPEQPDPVPDTVSFPLFADPFPSEAHTVLEQPPARSPVAAVPAAPGVSRRAPLARSASPATQRINVPCLLGIIFMGVAGITAALLLVFAGPRLYELVKTSLVGTPEPAPVSEETEPASPAGPSLLEMVQASWADRYRVTSLAHGEGVWAAILSHNSPYGRQTWGARQSFPGTFIEEQWQGDFRVTDLAYGDGLWTVVMSQDSPFGRQTWATRQQFPGDFINEQWDAGLRVTSLTYGDGYWAVVLSENSPLGRQTWTTRAQFPTDFIEAKWADGFRVTSLTYGNGVWAVIMSQGSPYGRQVWGTRRAFPEDFIERNRADGFRATNLAYGDGLWAVIVSQGTPYSDQIWRLR